jgi:peptidoglycan LD-endopeptidase LytH
LKKLPYFTLSLALFLSLAFSAFAAEPCTPCNEFSQLNTLIRDNTIGKSEARREIQRLIPLLRSYYQTADGKQYSRDSWMFPVQGYTIKTVGNTKGRGYISSGYNYFAGNRHGGHPSIDLFIRDRNQDSLDDRSGKPVNVLSITGGIVVALENKWEENSTLRGGKYLWVYDPASNALIYYAHNRELLVKVGDMLKPGDILATVGRTGLNAFKKRSPTHLHLTFLKISDGYPKPENIYLYLKNAPSKSP